MKIEKVNEDSEKQVRRTREVSTPLESIPIDTTNVKLPPAMQNIRSVKNNEHIPLMDNSQIPIEYSVPYECLCGDKIVGLPPVLHYKFIDGFSMTKLNELTKETFDVGLNSILDYLCYESKVNKFSHWIMPNSEKIRSFINLRINSESEFMETAIGVCQTCGYSQPFINLKLNSFEEEELNKNYREPWGLKILDSTKKEVRFKVRLIQSGDNQFAHKVYQSDKNLVREVFENHTDEDEKYILQVLEYANSILSIEDVVVPYENRVTFCAKNIESLKAITSFNDKFYYGMKLVQEAICQNNKCPSNTEENIKQKKTRGSLFQFPNQPSLFYISGEGKADKYFDDGYESN
jgi:hypothetical protein